MKSRHTVSKLLMVEEIAIIRKYSDDGYEWVNENLRNSYFVEAGGFVDMLGFVLGKLPSHVGIVYRGVDLNKDQIAKYNNKSGW